MTSISFGEKGPAGIPGPQGPAGPMPDLTAYDGDILPSEDNQYTLGNSDYRWKSISIGQGTIYITDIATNQQVALTVNNGVFFLDGIAQAQLPQLITNNIELHDGNDNVVLRLVEDSGVGKIYFGGGSNGIFQDGGKTYITGIAYSPESSGIKPMYYNSATGEITYDSSELHQEIVFVSSPPAHKYGKAGDKKYDSYLDNNYWYICFRDYVNNSTTCWYRLDTSSNGNW